MTATTESRNIEATKAIYTAVPAGDLQTALAHLDPDVRITYYGTENIPYAGDYRGIEDALTFFTKVGQTIKIVEMEPWKFIAQVTTSRLGAGSGSGDWPPDMNGNRNSRTSSRCATAAGCTFATS